MAFKPARSNTATNNVRYNSTLGWLFLHNETSERILAEVRGAIGDAEWKKGFTGKTGVTAAARKLASEKGLETGDLHGTLISAKVVVKNDTEYLNVGLRDENGTDFLSIPLQHQAAQMLVRKLANAKPGVYVKKLSLFATLEQKEGAQRAYANHGASLVQNDAEVSGLDVKATLRPAIDAAVAALKAAGIPDTDKETYAKRKAAVALDFHRGVMKEVENKFDAYRKQRDALEQKEQEEMAATQPDSAFPAEDTDASPDLAEAAANC